MTGLERCNEILRMIDAVLVDVAAGQSRGRPSEHVNAAWRPTPSRSLADAWNRRR